MSQRTIGEISLPDYRRMTNASLWSSMHRRERIQFTALLALAVLGVWKVVELGIGLSA